jgi:hypothetical protein
MVFHFFLHQSQSVKQWFMVAKVRYEWHAFGVHKSKEYMIDAGTSQRCRQRKWLMYESELFCQPLGERDLFPVCGRTRSYSYAFPNCGTVSHPCFPSAHPGQRCYHVKMYTGLHVKCMLLWSNVK